MANKNNSNSYPDTKVEQGTWQSQAGQTLIKDGESGRTYKQTPPASEDKGQDSPKSNWPY